MNTRRELKVIDTNVVIETGKIPDRVSGPGETECALRCIRFIHAFVHSRDSGIVLDQNWEILNEYRTVILREYGPVGLQAGPTGEFWKWALSYPNQPPYEDMVNLQKNGENTYDTFPSDPVLDGFDPPDRKFIAAACAHPDHPPVVEGTDCKWLKYRDALARHGVKIEFLCPTYILANYRRKFPGEEPPRMEEPT